MHATGLLWAPAYQLLEAYVICCLGMAIPIAIVVGIVSWITRYKQRRRQ